MRNKKYHIITIGCQMNKSDSERIAGYLECHGLRQAESSGGAGLIILNTCGVRQSAEDRVYGLIPRIKKENPQAKIILSGCLSQRSDVKKRLKGKIDIWLPIIELPALSKSLNIKGKKFAKDYLCLPPKYTSSLSAFVPIGNGCDNFCTYCVVPAARGREVYRPSSAILAESEKLAKAGCKEIILIAQNVNSYKSSALRRGGSGHETEYIYFSDLLKMVNDIPGNFWIRFATSHPKDMSDDLIKTMAKCPKICKHIHLPTQSGDNEILRAMNRNYTREGYISLIRKIRKKIPAAAITTDIIVGFPGETKKQFNNTLKLFKEVKFDMAYIARYSPRPGTAAVKLADNVSQAEKKRREEELMEILRKTALKNNEKYIGNTVEVLIQGENKKGGLYGKTGTNKNVKILNQKTKKQENMKIHAAGVFVKVKIIKARDFGLEGILI